MPSTRFERAVEDIKKLKAEPSQDEKLQLYGLFKVANGQQTQKPGTLDFKGQAKYKAWKQYHDSGMNADEAQEQYVGLANSLIEKIGFA